LPPRQRAFILFREPRWEPRAQVSHRTVPWSSIQLPLVCRPPAGARTRPW